MNEYEVMGEFIILFPLEEHRDTYEEINALQDIIKNALEKDHLKPKKVTVRIVHKPKKVRRK